jgi:hypothetical protein
MAYHYETLLPERFQQFCQSLLTATFPDAQCLPVGQPDGGRDAFLYARRAGASAERVAFQVKFVRLPEDHRDERKYLEEIAAGEAPKVTKLKADGISAYYLLTNVRGTSHYQLGSIDRVNEVLSAALDLPAYCWWRDDLDRRVDLHSDLKWSFPEIIIPLCDRARFARLKSGVHGWWREQILAARSEQERYFLLMLMMTWLTPKTMIKLSAEFSELLDALSPVEWEKIAQFSNVIHYLASNQKKDALADEERKILAKVSPRFLIAIASNTERETARKMYSINLANYAGNDEVVVAFCARRAFEGALNGTTSWDVFLRTARHAYRNNISVSVPGLHSQESRMPSNVAKAVCAKPTEFPLSVIKAAESVILKEIGSRVSKVGKVAQQERWFSA